MARDFARSKKTNNIAKDILVKHRLGMTISVPGCGQIRLREEALQEFVWILRSFDAEEHLGKWVAKIRTTIEDTKASIKATEEEQNVAAN